MLSRATFEFTDKSRNNQVYQHTYEVNLVYLSMTNKLFKTKEYKDFYKKEIGTINEYESDINIRDLYPLDIHANNKSEEVVELFNQINDKLFEIDNTQ